MVRQRVGQELLQCPAKCRSILTAQPRRCLLCPVRLRSIPTARLRQCLLYPVRLRSTLTVQPRRCLRWPANQGFHPVPKPFHPEKCRSIPMVRLRQCLLSLVNLEFHLALKPFRLVKGQSTLMAKHSRLLLEPQWSPSQPSRLTPCSQDRFRPTGIQCPNPMAGKAVGFKDGRPGIRILETALLWATV